MKVALKDWAKFQQTLGARFREGLRRGLQVAGQRAVFEMQKATEAKKVFDNGGFKRGWRFSTPEDHILRIYNQQPYGAVIEKGRRPGATPPPSSALVGWVKRKMHISGDAAARHVAFAVAQSIGVKGIPGKFVLRDSRDKLAQIIKEEVQRELKRTMTMSGAR